MSDAHERHVTLLKTVADATRLRILGLLAESPRSGKDLAVTLGLSAPTISHHMKRLEEVGVVRVTPDANRRIYSLDEDAWAPVEVSSGEGVPDLEDAAHRKTIRSFFDGERLKQIPAKRRARLSVLAELLRRFDPAAEYSEGEVNSILARAHEDVAFLRRELVDYRYLERHDGVYRVTQTPPVRDANEAQEAPAGEAEWLSRLIQRAVAEETPRVEARLVTAGAGSRWAASLTRPDGSLVSATAVRGRIHPGHDWLEAEDGWTPAELRSLVEALSQACGRPLSVKCFTDADRHPLLVAAGARAYQRCPPCLVPLDADVEAWASRQAGAELPQPMEGLPLQTITDWWLDLYSWIHESWSPLGSRDVAAGLFLPMLSRELLPHLSCVMRRSDAPVAALFAFGDADSTELEVIVESLTPTSATGVADVSACLAWFVPRARAAGCTQALVDHHETDPHTAQVVAGMPGVHGSVLELLEFPTR